MILVAQCIATAPNAMDCFEILLHADISTSACDIQGQTALHVIASIGHVPSLEMLLRGGCERDTGDEEGMTALHYAIKHQHVRAVTMLVYMGASVSVSDHQGRTAMHHAAIIGNLDILRVIMEYGGNMGMGWCDKHGRTSLHLAVCNSHVMCAAMLVCAGANPALEDSAGNTPQQLASTTEVCIYQ